MQYLGLIGNVFSQASPGFGSSNFAIVVTQLVNGKIQVIHAEEHERPDFSNMIQETWELVHKFEKVTNIYVDAANPEVWQALKREFNEPYHEQYMKERFEFCRKYNLRKEDQMFIVPIPFSTEWAQMLQHAKWLLDEKDDDGLGLVAIDRERFQNLITALRTAVANEYKLDKTATSFNDLLDAFRMNLMFYQRKK